MGVGQGGERERVSYVLAKSGSGGCVKESEKEHTA